MFFYIKKFVSNRPALTSAVVLFLLAIVDTFFGCLVDNSRWTPLFMLIGFLTVVPGIITFFYSLCEE